MIKKNVEKAMESTIQSLNQFLQQDIESMLAYFRTAKAYGHRRESCSEFCLYSRGVMEELGDIEKCKSVKQQDIK